MYGHFWYFLFRRVSNYFVTILFDLAPLHIYFSGILRYLAWFDVPVFFRIVHDGTIGAEFAHLW